MIYNIEASHPSIILTGNVTKDYMLNVIVKLNELKTSDGYIFHINCAKLYDDVNLMLYIYLKEMMKDFYISYISSEGSFNNIFKEANGVLVYTEDNKKLLESKDIKSDLIDISKQIIDIIKDKEEEKRKNKEINSNDVLRRRPK